ncbi:MAG: S8 family peptidase, partial [Gaiellaceae bacterium]
MRFALLVLCTVVVAAPPARAATTVQLRVDALRASTDAADPLVPSEWWRAAVHVDTLTPPGPGVPVSLVDSGVEFGHPEFAGDPNLIALNNQEPAPIGGVHGTAVASVVGAPVNGIGLVGIYPTAAIRSYDASLGDGTRLPSADIAAGILAAARAGRSVINLSLGSSQPDSAISAAVAEAVSLGSLVVAASGNSGEDGSPPSYPADNAHVLTVAATDQSDEPASFSTQSPYVDLAAPGVDIPVATALDNGYAPESGTSFSSPIVAGAAAWLWTVRPDLDASQVAEILRESARDVGPPGFDTATGYGILDLAAALVAPTPQADSAEPNDDVKTAATVTTRGRPSGTTTGR